MLQLLRRKKKNIMKNKKRHPFGCLFLWRRRRDSNKLLLSQNLTDLLGTRQTENLPVHQRKNLRRCLHSQISPAKNDSQNPFLNAVVFSKGSRPFWAKKYRRINPTVFFGGEGGTRTLAPVLSQPTPLAGAPRHHLSTSPWQRSRLIFSCL